MDDSGEVVINMNKLFQEEDNDGDDTLPLKENSVEKVDSARQLASQNTNMDSLFTEVEQLKHVFTDNLREITHEFTNCQKEVICSIKQIRDDFEAEILAIKGRIMKIEDKVQENEQTVIKIYHRMENRGKDNQPHKSESEYSMRPNINGQAAPATNKHENNTTQNTDENSLLDNVYNDVNQNYAELDRHRVPKVQVPNRIVGLPRVRNIIMKPQLYEGDDDLDEYLAQFEILAEINNWDYETKSLYLAGSLKGGARALLNELDKESRKDYDKLVMVLNTRYGSAEKSELFRAKLQSRSKGKDESIPELAQSIKKLTRQAYPNASSSLISVLALEHFVDAIPDGDVRLRLREHNPKSINEAETLAVRLEALKLAERQKGRFVRQADLTQSQDNLESRNEKQGFQEFKNEFSEVKRELISLTRELKGMAQNQNRNRLGGDNYRNYSNGPRRQFNDQNKNVGQGNRNFNPRNGNFGQNRPNQPNFSNQGNRGASNSGVGARQF